MIRNGEGGAAPTTDHSEGLAKLRMGVSERKIKWTRLNESVLTVRVSTDSIPVVREAISLFVPLSAQVKDLTKKVRSKARPRWPL